MKCIKCGVQLADDAKFCFNCGAQQNVSQQDNEEKQQNAYANTYNYNNVAGSNGWEQPVKIKAKKKKSKWPWFVGGGVVVVAAAAVTTILLLKGGISGGNADDPSDRYVQFIQDGQLNTIDINSRKYEPKTYSGSQDYMHMDTMIQYTDDGKYMCYPTNWDGDACRLYIAKTNASSEKAEKVDNNVSQYWLLNDHRVLYMKGDVLYLRDKKGNKEKVASDVAYTLIDEDQKNVIWGVQVKDSESNNNGIGGYDIYYRNLSLSDEKQKLISDAYLTASTKNRNKILAIQGRTLYLIEDFGDKKEIDDGVKFCLGFSEDENQFFYYKDDESNALDALTAMDIVEDDLADSDAQMKEPSQDDYKSSRVEKIDDHYEKYETTDWDAYDEAQTEYWEKEHRDELRQDLRDTILNTYLSELYSYEDGKIQIVDQSVDTWVQVNDRKIVFNKMNINQLEKIKLSEISYVDDVTSYFSEHKSECETSWVYNQGNLFELDQKISGYACEFSEDGNKAYALTDDDILVSFDMTGTGMTEEIMDDVDNILGVTDHGVYYLANKNDDNEGDLYFNGKMIDSDVYCDMFDIIEGTDTIYYGTDVNASGSGCTLKICDSGKTPKKIADDIAQAVVVNKNKIFVLADYRTGKMRGDLKLYSGRESLKTILEDVQYIINSDLSL